MPRQPEILAPLCRASGKSCGACCTGTAIDRATLTARLRRHRQHFPRTGNQPPSAVQLRRFELRVRHGLDLVLGWLLVLPAIGPALRGWLRPRLTCAFLAFDDAAETTIGCLLHPCRWQGVDRRQAAAFAGLPGFGCGGAAGCDAADRYGQASRRVREQFHQSAAHADWYEYSRLAPTFGSNPSVRNQARSPCPSSFTRP
jgi:hypothetical protein